MSHVESPVTAATAVTHDKPRNRPSQRKRRQLHARKANSMVTSDGSVVKYRLQPKAADTAVPPTLVCTMCRGARYADVFPIGGARCTPCEKMIRYIEKIGLRLDGLERLLASQQHRCALCEVAFGERVLPRVHVWNTRTSHVAVVCAIMCARCERGVNAFNNRLGTCVRLSIQLCTAQMETDREQHAGTNEHAYAAVLDALKHAYKALDDVKLPPALLPTPESNGGTTSGDEASKQIGSTQ